MIKSVKGVTMFLKNWVFLFALAIAASVGTQNLAQETEPLRTIVVIGEAQIAATPDKAVITLGARHVAKSAADALGETSKTVAAILSRMEKMGVERANMQTSSLTLNPVWRQGKRYDDDGSVLNPIGFEASNSVTVTLLDLARLGEALDQVARDGANSFSSFRFGLIDPEPIQDRARAAAVADARRKAELYALAAGLKLGEVLLITEEMGGSGGGFPPPVMEMAARSSSVPIARGEITRRSSVKVVFSIAP